MIGELFSGRVQRMTRRIEILEAQVRIQQAALEALGAATGVDTTLADPMERLDDVEEDLVRAGRKVHAIKHHRQRTGSTLLQAKNAVDAASRT